MLANLGASAVAESGASAFAESGGEISSAVTAADSVYSPENDGDSDEPFVFIGVN